MRQLFKRRSGPEALVIARRVLTQHVTDGQKWIVRRHRRDVDEVGMAAAPGETTSIPVDRSGIRAQQSSGAKEESRFPATFVPDYRNDLTPLHIEVDAT